tara:strand:+ start:25378 stop:25569 length:192 start_codon:yes stop_codon:yes gene_type:complete
MQLKEFTIILQNLLNRSVDIEIADATRNKRDVSLDKVEERLDALFQIAGKRIKQHSDRLGSHE